MDAHGMHRWVHVLTVWPAGLQPRHFSGWRARADILCDARRCENCSTKNSPGGGKMPGYVHDLVKCVLVHGTAALALAAACVPNLKMVVFLLTGAEVHCMDGSCSVDGACSSGYAELSIAVNTPPKMELLPVFASDANGIVQVPRGWLYQLCEPGNLGTEQEPCEPGEPIRNLTLCSTQSFAWACWVSFVALSLIVYCCKCRRHCVGCRGW